MTNTWPEGVTARHLTAAGVALADRTITVDIIDGNKAICRGCGRDWSNPDYPAGVTQWAGSHAESCLALPKP